MRRLEGKTALITGCNRGIGLAILKHFAAEGADVIACTRTPKAEFADLCSSLEKENDVKIFNYNFELTEEESIKAAMQKICKTHKKIDILVNNAGVAKFPGLMRLKMAELREVFQINFFAAVQITQSLIFPLMKSGNGTIVNIVSIAGLDPEPGNSVYGSSKAALINFTKNLSKELATAKIRVNCVAPGIIHTDMHADIESEKAKDVDNISLKRLGEAEEVAKTVLFLCSNDASYITGQVIRVDGGM